MGLAARLSGWAGLLLVGGVVLALAGWRWAGVDPATAKVEGALLDLRFQLRGARPPPENVVIVAVDERAVAEIGAYAPLRAALARALDSIAAGGPRVLAIDVLLVDETEADAELATALRQAGPVLLAVAATGREDAAGAPSAGQETALTQSALPVVIGAPPAGAPVPGLLLPTPRLAEAGMLAHVNVSTGQDAAVRAVPLALRVGGGRLLPSMALAAARYGLGAGRGDLVYRYGGDFRIGDRTLRPDDRGRMALDHYGPPGTLTTIGLQDVLAGRAPPGGFADRVVFVGSTAPSLRDEFATPFSSAVAGVEVLATATANILEGRQLRRDAGTFAITAFLGLTAALCVLAAFRIGPLALSLAAALVVWAAAAGAVQFAFAQAGLWLDGVTVLGGLLIGTAYGARARLGREQRQRTNLAHYVAPSLVRQLSESAHPSFDGREQNVGILFVDVSGYSGMVESRRPAEVAVFLRELHALFEDEAEAHGGLIIDYQGDGALIAFGLPDASPADAANALACGEALLAGRDRVHARFLDGPLGLRVSVHWGPVACAVLGGRRHAQVSVTGDAVNVTARLQEFAKAHDATFVATRAALDAAGNPRGFRPLGREPLRGRRVDVEVWGREAMAPGSA